jgi:hypothetical protein
MCVLQCPCGMVVSTNRCQARCIRCGTVLGAKHLISLPKKTPDGPAKKAQGEGRAEKSNAEAATGASGARRQDVLAKYVSLVIIAAARSLRERGAT